MKSNTNRPEKRNAGSWIRASFWKYALKASLPCSDSTLRGERNLDMAFESLNSDASRELNFSKLESGLRASMLSGMPSSLLTKDCLMKRVDPDCVDSLFAEYDGEQWTGTTELNPLDVDLFQEQELLSGMEAIIDFIQAAQAGSVTETVPASSVKPSKHSQRR